MACSHPLFAYQTAEGLKPIIIKFGDLINEKYYIDKTGQAYPILKLPCGHCINCRLQYSRNWADRCMLEAQKYEHNEFLTITYDPEHLPQQINYDSETGEYLFSSSPLIPKDLTDFVKRLRQAFSRGQYKVTHEDGTTELLQFPINENIRFYACGEYGDLHQRPHYHLIVFNLDVPDKRFLFTNGAGSQNYTSDLIKSIWNKGLISLCPVTWETCAYTARYVMKKQKGLNAKEYYESKGLVPEFVRMSRRPGIARDYYEEHKDDIYKYDSIYLKKGEKLERLKPARYYDKLYDLEYPEKMQEVKDKRKIIGETLMESKLSKSTFSEREFLEHEEEMTLLRTKQLQRNFEKYG